MVLIISLIANLSILSVKHWADGYCRHINHFLDEYSYVVNEFSLPGISAAANPNPRTGTVVSSRKVFIGSPVTPNWLLENCFRDVIIRSSHNYRHIASVKERLGFDDSMAAVPRSDGIDTNLVTSIPKRSDLDREADPSNFVKGNIAIPS